MKPKRSKRSHKGQVSGPGAKPKDKKKKEPQIETVPRVGISTLDCLLDTCTLDMSAAIYTCLEITLKDKALGDRILKRLRGEFKSIRERNLSKDLDIESDVLPIVQWLSFLEEFENGLVSAL